MTKFTPTKENAICALMFAAGQLEVQSDPAAGKAVALIPVDLLAHFHANKYDIKLLPHPQIPGAAVLTIQQAPAESKLFLPEGTKPQSAPDPAVGIRLKTLLDGGPEHQS